MATLQQKLDEQSAAIWTTTLMVGAVAALLVLLLACLLFSYCSNNTWKGCHNHQRCVVSEGCAVAGHKSLLL